MGGDRSAIGEEGQGEGRRTVLEDSSRKTAVCADGWDLGFLRFFSLSLGDGQWFSSGASDGRLDQFLFRAGGDDAMDAGRENEGQQQHHRVEELCPKVHRFGEGLRIATV